MPATEPVKTKALVVATRCTSIDQFVATFHRFCDDSTFFVSTLAERPVGLETAFSIQLEDKTPVLRGLCEVVETWSTPLNRFGRPGVRLAVRRLTNESLAVFKMLQDARLAAEASPEPPAIARTATGSPMPPPSIARTSTASTATPAVARTATGSTTTTPLGAPLARLPLTRISQVTPPPTPRKDPRVSEAPSLPLYDDRSGPIAAMPIVTTPPVLPAPVVAAPRPLFTRTPPKPTPSIIVADDMAAPAVEAAPYVPEPIAASDDLTNPIAVESRTPGSSFILPANPLSNLTDQSLGGFVDCALYEETGNFFRAPGYEDSLVDLDDMAASPPPALSPVSAIRHETVIPPGLSVNAFSPQPPREQLFAPEATPLPMLAPTRNTPPRPYSEPLIPANAVPYTPAPEAPRTSPIDSTAALLAMSSPNRRRWLMIGGAAAATSLLVIAIVIVKGGGGDPKPPPVKVAAMQPRVPESNEPRVPSPPDVAASDVTPPSGAATSPSEEIAAAAVPIVLPDETTDPTGPPVVGTGPCRLTVSSTPAGSMVRVDDQSIGPSPVTFNGPCKRSKVDVRHPRYAFGTKWVVLSAAKPTEIQVPLARPTHAITIVTIPPGATISIGGNRAGTTPTSVKVMGFTGMKLTFEKKGYSKLEQKVYSKVDGARLTFRLVRGK